MKLKKTIAIFSTVVIVVLWFGGMLSFIHSSTKITPTLDGVGNIPDSPYTTRSTTSATGNIPDSPTRSTTSATTVALLVPVRASHGTTEVAQLSFFQELYPSFLRSLLCDNQQQIQFVFFLGFDAGDPFWDDPVNIEGIRSVYEALWTRQLRAQPEFHNMLPPQLVIQRYVGMISAPAWIWNHLLADAMLHPTPRIEYFFQVNDDTKILTACWGEFFLCWFALFFVWLEI